MMGILIVEDVTAVIFLTFLSSSFLNEGCGGVSLQVLETIGGGLGLLALGYLVARYVVPMVIDYLSHYVVESVEIPLTRNWRLRDRSSHQRQTVEVPI